MPLLNNPNPPFAAEIVPVLLSEVIKPELFTVFIVPAFRIPYPSPSAEIVPELFSAAIVPLLKIPYPSSPAESVPELSKVVIVP